MKIKPYPHYDALADRISRQKNNTELLQADLFRMITPQYSKDNDIISGTGGYKSSGRWNLKKQFHCTYLSRTPETALEEVLAPSRRKNFPDANSLPRVLVCISVKLHNLLDLTEGQIRKTIQVSRKRMIEQRWWIENFHGREAVTQAISRAAFTQHFEGIIAPSAADTPHGLNIIVFQENLSSASRISVITPIAWK